MSGIATSTTDVVIDTNENVMKNEGKFTKNDEEETKKIDEINKIDETNEIGETKMTGETSVEDEEDKVEEVDELDEIFNILADGDGTLSVTSFCEILREIGLNPTEDELLGLLRTVDLDLESHLTIEHFHTLIKEYEVHDATLHEIVGGTNAPPLQKTLSSHGSALRLEKDGHSDMYWVNITTENWPNFPIGFKLDQQFRVTKFTPPDDYIGGSKSSKEMDILQMVDDRKIEKRFPVQSINTIISKRLKDNGHVNLKFRRHINHEHYSGEYVVGFTKEVPNVGVVEENVILGPIDKKSDAYHQGICCGDLILSINNEDNFNALNTKTFQQICNAALIRDGKVSLHLEHSEHRAEIHHDLIHEKVHKGFRFIFGGGFLGIKSKRRNEKFKKTQLFADAV
jgi:hypothetical protein